jgi:hypothetical protein
VVSGTGIVVVGATVVVATIVVAGVVLAGAVVVTGASLVADDVDDWSSPQAVNNEPSTHTPTATR